MPSLVPVPIATFLVRRRVAIMLATGILAFLRILVTGSWPNAVGLSPVVQGTGICLVFAGLLIRSWATAVLKKGEELATIGPYSMCRHPLYAGSTLMILGFCVLVGDWVVAGMLLGVWGITYPLAVAAEESRLAIHFATNWEEYAARVPALLPRRLPSSLGRISSNNWFRNEEYRAAVAGTGGVVFIEIWRLCG